MHQSDYFLEHGYVVLPGLVPVALIDRLMQVYRRDIAGGSERFFRQNTGRYESNRFTPAGYVKQSFLDIHNYKKYPEFRKCATDIFLSEQLMHALSAVSGSARHNLMQSMFFDANAETNPHQDWWYLDSVPNGHLLAAWIALEDIHEDAGRFFVFPGSHQVVLHEAGMAESAWLARVDRYVAEHAAERLAPALAKGDVLFWNSRTIHGSLATRDVARSRKSLTAHYLPSQMTFGNLFVSKPWIRYEEIDGHLTFANQPEYSLKARAVSGVKKAIYDSPRLMRLVRRFQNRAMSDLH